MANRLPVHAAVVVIKKRDERLLGLLQALKGDASRFVWQRVQEPPPLPAQICGPFVTYPALEEEIRFEEEPFPSEKSLLEMGQVLFQVFVLLSGKSDLECLLDGREGKVSLLHVPGFMNRCHGVTSLPCAAPLLSQNNWSASATFTDRRG